MLATWKEDKFFLPLTFCMAVVSSNKLALDIRQNGSSFHCDLMKKKYQKISYSNLSW